MKLLGLCLLAIVTQVTASKLRFAEDSDKPLHRAHHHAKHHRLLKKQLKQRSRVQDTYQASQIAGGCNASIPPENGDVGDCSSVLASGGTCTPTCNLGYVLSGVSSCNSGTLVSATCSGSPCAVKAPTNGTVGNCPTQLPDGGQCSPQCDNGFTINGKSSCTLGAFSSATCSPSYCVATAPTNGVLGSCPGQIPHGASCSPTCNTGYSLTGLSHCTYGTFGSAACLPSACDSSQPPANGAVGDCPAQLGDGQSCQPKCNNGFSVSGKSSCTLGQLTPVTCVARPCSVSAPENGGSGNCPYDDKYLPHSGTCAPTCNPGYTVSGLTSCNKGVLFPATCSPSSCVFKAPDNGVADACPNTLAHGTSCSPKCNSGYSLLGLSSCVFGALSSATCAPNPCAVQAPVNGNLGSCSPQLTHSGTCVPGCNVGYSVNGVSSCSLGTFTSASCSPASCTAQAPINGTFGTCQGQLKHGETCAPTCNEGYAVSGLSTCNMGSLSTAVCNPLSCTTEAPTNGASGNCQGKLQHGGICAPACDTGYSLVGLSSCSFGTFSTATCVPSNCTLEAPANGVRGNCSTNMIHGDSCSPTCNAGYVLSGPSSCSFGSIKRSTCEQVIKVTLQNNGQNYCSTYCGTNMNNELAGWAGACCLSATTNDGKSISCTEYATQPIKCNCKRSDATPFGDGSNPLDSNFVCPEVIKPNSTSSNVSATSM
jgi:hypothetical protein